MPATGLFDYYSELDGVAWFDQEELPVVWFDHDLIVAASVAAGLAIEPIVALQAVNRAGTF